MKEIVQATAHVVGSTSEQMHISVQSLWHIAAEDLSGLGQVCLRFVRLSSFPLPSSSLIALT